MEAEKGKNEVSKFGMSYRFKDTIQVNVAVVSCSFPIRPSHLILQGFPALSLMISWLISGIDVRIRAVITALGDE